MAALNPDHLLDQADRLTQRRGRAAPRQADLRRAVSSAYYGLFHAIVGRATDDFFGAALRNTKQYENVYRGVAHGKVRRVCEGIARSAHPRSVILFGQALTAVSGSFINLYEKRHLADYAPLYQITESDAILEITSARLALNQFRTINGAQRKIFSALILL